MRANTFQNRSVKHALSHQERICGTGSFDTGGWYDILLYKGCTQQIMFFPEIVKVQMPAWEFGLYSAVRPIIELVESEWRDHEILGT